MLLSGTSTFTLIPRRRIDMAVKKIKGSEIKGVAGRKDRLSLVDFSADWCGPCKMLHPVLETVSEELADKVDFYMVDVDQSQNEAASLGIRGVPTMIVFHDGSEIDRMVGFRDNASLSSQLIELADSRIES